MDAYMIDANGLVTRAHENVQRKMRELMEAQEQLTIARLLSRVKSIQSVAEFPVTDTNEKTQPTKRKYTKRKGGYTKATIVRKQALLKWWLESRSHEEITYEEVRIMVINLGNSHNNGFGWCKGLSENTILSIYNYIKESMGQSNGN